MPRFSVSIDHQGGLESTSSYLTLIGVFDSCSGNIQNNYGRDGANFLSDFMRGEGHPSHSYECLMRS